MRHSRQYAKAFRYASLPTKTDVYTMETRFSGGMLILILDRHF
jgi:hypothetical protein